MLKKFLLILFVTISLLSEISAQKDTIIFKETKRDTITEGFDFLDISKKKKPGRAALYSAVLPGLGQAYNGSYWKIPAIYSVLGSLVFFADYSDKKYKIYLNSYIAEKDTLASTVSEFKDLYSADDLEVLKDNSRRNRDFTYILIFAAYGLSIIEANVDAHLSDFDVNDDLSLKIFPSFTKTYYGANIPAINFYLRF